MRGNKETAKGAEMERKHAQKVGISKFKGTSSSYSFKRPQRKVVTRHAR